MAQDLLRIKYRAFVATGWADGSGTVLPLPATRSLLLHFAGFSALVYYYIICACFLPPTLPIHPPRPLRRGRVPVAASSLSFAGFPSIIGCRAHTAFPRCSRPASVRRVVVAVVAPLGTAAAASSVLPRSGCARSVETRVFGFGSSFIGFWVSYLSIVACLQIGFIWDRSIFLTSLYCLVQQGFIIVRNYLIGLRPWNPEHGSTAVSLQTVLTSSPLNIHLATNIPLSDPYEHLTIHITGIPPHLCCNSLIHKLFHKICIIHSVNFISATTEYEVSARGRLTMIPQIAHLGIRNLSGQSEVINIWQLSYQTFTDEMLGRQTPPGDRRSDLRGYSDIDTEQRLELVDSDGNNEATSRLQVASDTSSMDTYNSNEE
ncbi:hypothetical protein BDA96_08G065800 [Sorghum bicolor]|uniref:Uncharacterized protein n=2 Tax=Sorghum bicolor TaxID=4558 RepID=A0A921QFY4_SORBI|nr:hypothetical protein BDA96_08G065800 [Sorghum bicolor]OQU78853.1 hypothetical protein SORBI_3008G061201 [Sorghum bicolor]